MADRRLALTNVLIAGLSVALAAGCSGGGSRVSASGASSATEDSAATAGEWLARAPRGGVVRVKADTGSLRPGRVELAISIDEPGADSLPVTVDLASPTMPMHGIKRFPARRVGRGRFVATVEIPMEGSWALYVNLDDGTEAAQFEFDVPGPDSVAHGHDSSMHPH